MLPPGNRPLVVAREDEEAFSAALDSLAARPDLRRGIGRANLEKAAADYDEAAMIARYAALYGAAIGRGDAFMSAGAT
jgi:glycosyltransferase involved in cell wall biosynthesis